MSCMQCGAVVDPLRVPARVIGARIGSLCPRCAGHDRAAQPARRVVCSACGDEVEAWRARPVLVRGAILLSCPACAAPGLARDAKVAGTAAAIAIATTAVTAPAARGDPAQADARADAAEHTPIPVGESRPIRRRRARRRAPGAWAAVAAGGGCAVLALLLTNEPWAAGADDAAPPSIARSQLAQGGRAVTGGDEADVPDVAPPPPTAPARPANAAAPAVAEAGPPAASSVQPWEAQKHLVAPLPPVAAGQLVHPIPGPGRDLPSGQGLFGSHRPGERAPECAGGHCGVDLGSVIGTPILAVRDGEVVKVDRRGGGRSGRHVLLRHDDGMETWYMHLEVIRTDLEAGMQVAAGEAIATLGRTGIVESPSHLHFAVTVVREFGRRYVDPYAMLARAVLAAAPVLDDPERWPETTK